MPSSFPPPEPPPELPSEAGESRDALLTFVPPVVVAFLLDWALTAQWGWPTRRALVTSIAVGILLALLLQRALARTRRR